MITKEFKIEYSKLNIKQKEAVDTIDGPVMVVAGPGTGKTTILTLRIANILLKTDTGASGILALTFTDSGVKAMREKLIKIIGQKAFEIPIYTFHGFASSMINEFEDHFPHLRMSKQITDVESENLMRRLLKQKKFSKLRPLGDPDFYISKILGTISKCKQEAWTPEIINDFAKNKIENLKNNESSISTRGKSKGNLKAEVIKEIEKCEKTIIFSDVYKEYEKIKKEEKKIDFDDLIFELILALKKDKLLLQLIQEKFLYILVDEHQDTNDAQNLIVSMLADFFDTPNIFVVGDEKQAIYRFQGASIENFLSLEKKWGKLKTISLEENFRSNQNILDNSFSLIENNYEKEEYQKLRIKLKSKSKEKNKPINVITAINEETEENYLVEQVSNLSKKGTETVALIFRKNSDLNKMYNLLQSAGLKISAERGINIFSHRAGILYFALLEFLYEPENKEALAKTIALGLWNLSFQEKIKYIKLIKSDNFEEINKIKNFEEVLMKTNTTGPIEFLIEIANLSFYTEIIKKDIESVEVWRSIIDLAQDLAKTNRIENPRELIEILLSYKKTAENKIIKINSNIDDSNISLMTAHSSKGLEFDYVFIPFANEENWIRKNTGNYFLLPKQNNSEDDIKDERRLFYVAITRAKKHVCISLHKQNLNKEITPLRFINELDQKLITNKEIPKYKDFPKKYFTPKKYDKEKIDYTKQVLLENGLSVTALNHYIKCPNQFFYKSILRVPEAPTASSEKGNAMHEALANVWEKIKNDKMISYHHDICEILKSSIKNYFKKSLLSKNEKEIILEELLANAPKVAEALADHFKQEGKIYNEIMIKTPFSTNIKNEDIQINLHGRLDTVIETDKNISVYDYKTTEAMSLNKIKGETKDGDGNYFRQLIFYKILLEDNHKFKEKKVEPSLIFVKPSKNGSCPTISIPIEKENIKEVKDYISKLIEDVWTNKVFDQKCSDPDCEYCKLKLC